MSSRRSGRQAGPAPAEKKETDKGHEKAKPVWVVFNYAWQGWKSFRTMNIRTFLTEKTARDWMERQPDYGNDEYYYDVVKQVPTDDHSDAEDSDAEAEEDADDAEDDDNGKASKTEQVDSEPVTGRSKRKRKES